MSVDLAELGLSVTSEGIVVATSNLHQLEQKAKQAETATDRLAKAAVMAGAKMQRAGRSMTLYLTAPMIAAGAAAVKLAVDAEETANKFEVVFRGSIERSEAALRELSKTIPLTVTQMKGLASGVQDMLVPMGLVREEAADLSLTAVKLAGDIASFNNVGTDEVLRGISSALAGQSEPLRKYGIDVLKTRLKLLALENGLIDVGEEMNKAAEAQAIFIAIQQDSADAMGDAARTVESTANQTRFFARDIKQLSEDIGKDLIPVYAEFLGVLKDGLSVLTELTPETRKVVIETLAWTAAIGPLLIVFGSLIRAVGTFTPLLIGLGVRMLALFGPAGLVFLGISALGLLAIAMHDAKAPANELDTEIQNLIDSVEGLGKTAFDFAFANLNIAMTENAATVRNLKDHLNALATQYGQTREAWIPDRIDYFNERLRIATEEGARLQGQLEQLTAAQAEFAAKTKESGDVLTPPEGGAEWAAADTEALAALLEIIDPLTVATERYAAARALLDKAFTMGKINFVEHMELLYLLRRSKIAADAFTGSIKKNDVLLKRYAATMKLLEENFDWLDALDDLDNELDGLRDQFDPLVAGLNALDEARDKVAEGFSKGLIGDDEFARMNDGIDKAESSLRGMHDSFANGLNATIQGLEQVRGLFHEDSEAAERLNSVLQIMNVVAGVYAVIKQLQGGDVYSAIPRALGVAALVASMGVETGAAGSATAEKTRQETQGTGSVLGDSEAKSESILNALEITANATSELVGINRGMLHALTSLQTGLAGAVVQLARGSGGADIQIPEAKTAGFIDFLLPDIGFIGKILNKIFGGKTKLLDTGIQIEGGMLTDMINDVFVQAFADIKTKKWILGSYKFKTIFEEMDSEVGKQFVLVFQSIYDTVEQAAIAIGIPLDDIQERLASFEIETVKISLKDLSAEEQQEEILAVFSKIFDDLAGHVIPFIEDFQKVGEGLGETLVRVATSVQVMQEAIMALGLTVDDMDAESFARMSVDLVELTGGVEEFISKFTTFFDKFANESQKLEFLTSQVERAFAEVGLEVPKTSAGMWELMQSLDATTEEGREQIAMLLNISATAAEYYDLLEDATENLLKQVQQLRAFTGDTVFSGLLELRDNFKAAMKAADALGASQREYSLIAGAFNRQLQRMAAELTISVISQVKQLFGDETEEIANVIVDGFGDVDTVVNQVFEGWMSALESIHNFMQSVLLNEQLTTLTPAEQLAEAQSQFDSTLADALAGDAEAAAALPAAAKALLEEARFMFASGQQYTDIFNSVLAALARVDIPDNIPPTIVVEPDPVEPPMVGPEAPTDPNEALAEELNRFLMALDLAGTLRNLSQVLNTSVIGLAEELGVPLRELVTLMGVELENISVATAAGLGEVAVLLGADIFELMDALDIGLGDLLAELPEGIRGDLEPLLDAIRAATTEADVTEGVDNLGGYVLGLPADLQLLLQPFLDWFAAPDVSPELSVLAGIETNTADIVAAIHALITTMGGEIEPLVVPPPIVVVDPPDPIVVPPPVLPPIVVEPPIIPPPIIVPTPPPVVIFPPIIFPPIYGPFPHEGFPQYADGGSVDKTGPAMLHAGEFVVTKTADNMNISAGETGESSRDELADIKTILNEMLEQNRRYQETDLRLSGDMETSLKTSTEQARRIANA